MNSDWMISSSNYRWGHNEMDDPSFTQPIMYNKIKSRATLPDAYADKLVVCIHISKISFYH